MSAPDLYAEAVARVNGGWSIIPIRNDPATGQKRAACKWEPYQERRPTPDELVLMFRLRGLTGLAAIAGRVSGGLFFRDFDLVTSYERWAAAYPDLARTLPTYETGRGFQVAAYCPKLVQTRDLGDGELRGERAYSVLPPSLHPAGKRYIWITAGPEIRMTLDPDAAGLTRPWCPDIPELLPEQREQRNRESESRRNGDPEEVRESADAETERTPALPLAELIRRALPESEHQNHRSLFLLARGVKALERAAGKEWTLRDLEKLAFAPWYEQNRHLRPEQTREQYLAEFLLGYDLVRLPLGDGVIEATWAKAATLEPPPAARQFVSPDLQRVVTWCYLLQGVAGDAPFFLSVRTLQGKLGLGSPQRASAILRRLVDAGILAEVEKGGRDTNKATRFRFLAVA
jgi:hypothetical protein